MNTKLKRNLILAEVIEEGIITKKRYTIERLQIKSLEEFESLLLTLDESVVLQLTFEDVELHLLCLALVKEQSLKNEVYSVYKDTWDNEAKHKLSKAYGPDSQVFTYLSNTFYMHFLYTKIR